MMTRLCRVFNCGIVQILSATVGAKYTQVDLAQNENV